MSVAACDDDTGNPDAGTNDLATIELDQLQPTPVSAPYCTDKTCFNFLSPTPAPCPDKDPSKQPGCIFFKRMGDPNAKEKVVLQGGAIFDDAEQFRFVQPLLAQKYDVVAYDFLGFGRSSHPPGRFSMITQAEVTIQLMNYLGWQKAHIAAFSLGGTVMQTLGKTPQYRDRVVSLVGINPVGILTAPPDVNFPQQNMIFFSNLPSTGFIGTEAMLRELHFQKDRVTEELVKDVIKGHLRYNADLAYTIALFDGFSLAMGLTTPNDYGAFTGIPFGLIFSEKDESQPPASWYKAYQSIPGIQLVTMIPNCGHDALQDCSKGAADAYIQWIDAHPTSTAMDMGTTD